MANNKKKIPKALLLALGLLAVIPTSKALASEQPALYDAKELSSNEVDKAKNEVERLEKEVDGAKEKLDQAQEELTNARSIKEASDSKLADAEANYQKAQAAKDEADKKLHEALEKQGEASDEVIDLYEQKETQRQAEADLAKAKEALEAAKIDSQNKENEVKTAEENYNLSLENYNLASDMLAEANADYESIKSQYDEKVSKINQDISDGESEVEKINNDIENVDNSDYKDPKKEADLKGKDQKLGQAEDDYFSDYNDYVNSIIALNEGKNQVKDKEKEIEKLNKEIEEAKNEWHDIYQKLKANDPSVSEEDEQAALDRLNAIEEKNNSKIAELEEEIDALNEQSEASEQSLLEKEKELGNLFTDLANKTEFYEGSKASLEVSKDIASGNLTLENIDETIEKAEEEADKATVELENALLERENARDNYYNTLDLYEYKKNQYKDWIRHFQDLIDKNTGYWSEEDVEGFIESRDNYQALLDNLDNEVEVEEAKKAYDEAETRSYQATEALEVATGKILALYEAEGTLKNLEEENKKKIEELQKSLKEAEEKLASNKKALALADEELNNAKAYVDEVKELLEESRSILDQDEKALEEARNNLKEATEKLEELQKQVEDLEAKVAQNSVSKEDLDKAKENLEQAKKDVADAKSKLEEAKKDLDAAKTELDEAKKEKESADNTLKDAEGKVRLAEEELKAKEDELEVAKNKLSEKEQEKKLANEKRLEEEKLNKEKDSARKAIGELKNLADNDRSRLDDLIQNAKSSEDIERIKELAKSLDEARKNTNNKEESEKENSDEQTPPAKPEDPEIPADKKVDETRRNKLIDRVKNLRNLSDEEKANLVERLEKVNSDEGAYEIYKEALRLNNSKENTSTEKPAIDKDYKDLFLGNLKTLSKLTEAEKREFERRIDAANSNGQIYDIYNQAIALNNLRKEKPSESSKYLNRELKDVLSSKIDGFVNLSKLEKESFKEKIEKSSTSNEAYDYYYQAYRLNDLRKNNFKTRPVLERPRVEASDSEVRVPSYKEESEPRPTSNIVYVKEGYRYIKSGFYNKSDLIVKRDKLKDALKRNEILVEAVKLLFKNTPKTVASVRDKLEALIVDAQAKQVEARDALKELEEILY